MKAAALALTICLTALPRVAAAEHPHDIVVDIPGERSTTNLAVLGGLTGAGVLVAALGVYFHLDSRSLSDELSATSPTGKAWTPEDESKAHQASDDRTRAAIAYSIGGALIVGAAVAYIVTEPASERQVIRPHTTVAPTQGGALVAHWWSF